MKEQYTAPLMEVILLECVDICFTSLLGLTSDENETKVRPIGPVNPQ